MKRITVIILAIVFCLTSVLAFAGQTRVKGYYRKDGTYVQPYYRTTPNQSRTDNYSYPGNYNTNTGRQTPYSTSPQQTWPTNPNPYDTDSGAQKQLSW